MRKLSKASPKSKRSIHAGDKPTKKPKRKTAKRAREPKIGTRAAAWKEFTDELDQYMRDYWKAMCEQFGIDPKKHPYRKPKSEPKFYGD